MTARYVQFYAIRRKWIKDFSLKQIKEIIDDSGSVLRNALIQQKEKPNQEIEHKTHMIHIIQEILTDFS